MALYAGIFKHLSQKIIPKCEKLMAALCVCTRHILSYTSTYCHMTVYEGICRDIRVSGFQMSVSVAVADSARNFGSRCDSWLYSISKVLRIEAIHIGEGLISSKHSIISSCHIVPDIEGHFPTFDIRVEGCTFRYRNHDKDSDIEGLTFDIEGRRVRVSHGSSSSLRCGISKVGSAYV
jgi:hypothetical protein